MSAAILLTGHVRDACQDHTHLLRIQNSCKNHYSACYTFICTWSTTERLTPSHSPARHIPRGVMPCLAQIYDAVNPDYVQIETQILTNDSRTWGASRVSVEGMKYHLSGMASCAAAAVRWKTSTPLLNTYRVRFERRFEPSISIWESTPSQGRITTHEKNACKANIDNVFWGVPRDVELLLQTWFQDAESFVTPPRRAVQPGAQHVPCCQTVRIGRATA